MSDSLQWNELAFLGIALTTAILLLLSRRYSKRYIHSPKDVCTQERFPMSVPRLQKHWWLFGIDTIYQDICDLRNHNSSHRAFLRHQTLGTTYLSSTLGRSTIHTIDPVNIRTITTHNFEDYEKGDWAQVIARYMGKGVLVNDGLEWTHSRELLKPLFRRNKNNDIKKFEEHVNRLVLSLEQQRGEFVDFRRAAQMAVLDVTTEMLCAHSTLSLQRSILNEKHDELDDREERNLLDLIDDLEPFGRLAIELGPLSLPVFVWHYRRIMDLVKGIQGFFQRSVHDNIANGYHESEHLSKDAPMIEQMLKQGLSPGSLQGELQNIFFAAFDTTTALLANVFDCICRYPEVQQRLRAELNGGLHNHEWPNETELSRLLYLRATILETLRLHSPITYHTRKARVDTILPRGGGDDTMFVPKGTAVVWSTYALNRRSDLYALPDWEAFRPDRWIEVDSDSARQRLVVRDEFMPFGSGPRNCLGQQFAMLLTSHVTARLLRAFEGFEMEEGGLPFQEAAAVTYYNGRGTRIKFLPRKSIYTD